MHIADAKQAYSRELADGVVAFVGILDIGGRVLEVNEPGLKASGLLKEDVEGKLLWDCPWYAHDPEAKARVRDAVRRAVAGETSRFDLEVRVAGDERMDVDLQFAPMRDVSGTIIGVVPSAIDISDRKASERALKASHDTFKRMVESSPFGVMVVDDALKVTMLSEGAAAALSAFTPLIGRALRDILRAVWPETLASDIEHAFRHTLETGLPHAQATRCEVRADTGRAESYDWRLARVVLPGGRYGVVCNFYDLTERDQFEIAVERNEKMFRSTFENAAVGMAHVALDGSWLRVNRCLCQILGYTREEMEGKTFQDLTHPDDLDADLTQLGQIVRGEIDNYSMEKRYYHKDGEIVWASLSVGCVHAPDGEVEYLIANVVDITAQKEAEDQRQLLVQELHHRVKNLLATTQSVASQTIRSSHELSDFKERFMGRLTAISKAHDSIFDTESGKAAVRGIVCDQFEVYYPESLDRFDVDGPAIRLPAAKANSLAVIIHELLTNAMKYGALSNETGRVSVSWERTTAQDGQDIQFTWTETEGPKARTPDSIGFGSRLIRSMVQGSLGGSYAATFRPGGLRATFSIKVDWQ